MPSFRLSIRETCETDNGRMCARWEKKASFQESRTSLPFLTIEHHTGAAASRNSRAALLMQSSLPSITDECHNCFAAAQPQHVEPRPSKLDATGDGAGTVTAIRYGPSCGDESTDDDRSPHTSLTATSGQQAQATAERQCMSGKLEDEDRQSRSFKKP